MSKSPAFQLYAADFYMDTITWTNEEVGSYLRLLLYEWINGPIPNDAKVLYGICGLPKDKHWRRTWDRIWPKIGPKFTQIGSISFPHLSQYDPSFLGNIRLESERDKQLNKAETQRNNINNRWHKHDTTVLPSNEIGNTLHTSTSSSLSINNNTIEKKPRKKFLIPTIEEITQYCKERKNNVDPKTWFDHYESNGWMVGKNKMNNWKAAVRTWEHRKFDDGGSYGRGKGNSDDGPRVQPPIYNGDQDLPTEEERKRGLQRLAELKKLAGGIG